MTLDTFADGLAFGFLVGLLGPALLAYFLEHL